MPRPKWFPAQKTTSYESKESKKEYTRKSCARDSRHLIEMSSRHHRDDQRRNGISATSQFGPGKSKPPKIAHPKSHTGLSRVARAKRWRKQKEKAQCRSSINGSKINVDTFTVPDARSKIDQTPKLKQKNATRLRPFTGFKIVSRSGQKTITPIASTMAARIR